ncbi:MAG: hypothetical protein M3065_08580 [Actinomycetota bacterium]|nr:hypothetical protein [Actinomycetota bacterium]
MTKFEGFEPKVHEWFKGLEADNCKEYFAANRDFFEVSIRPSEAHACCGWLDRS